MLVIPVLDVQKGVVVRGVGGRRHEYKPIVSKITESNEPLTVARAFRDTFGLDEIYLADLDAIAGETPSFDLYRLLLRDGFKLWVDAGIRVVTDAKPFDEFTDLTLVIGSETIRSGLELNACAAARRERKSALSVDMKKGEILLAIPDRDRSSPDDMVNVGVNVDFHAIILLDLSDVGENHGMSTLALLERSRSLHPQARFIVGGGVRGPEDLKHITNLGAYGVLIASALHDGRIKRADLEVLRR